MKQARTDSTLRSGAAHRFYRRYGKRALDLALSFLALLFLWPIMGVIVSLVWARMGRPVVFQQERPGLLGKVFVLRKFRSMTNERTADGELLPADQRLTRFGSLLRKTSMDELPEILNVLRGEMSLVGPRPLLVDYLPLYNAVQARRHEVRPGLTGWAQVNGRNALTWEDRFRLDVWYVDHMSLPLDIKILAMTVLSVVKREGINAQGDRIMPRFAGSTVAAVKNRASGTTPEQVMMDSRRISMPDMPKKRILVVGAGWDQAPIIQEAKRQGHYVIAVDGNPDAYGLQFADKALEISTRDKEGILAVATKEKVDALTYMITESPLYAIRYAADHLGLPAPSHKAVESTVSKPRMREIYRDAGIPNPRFGRAANLAEAIRLTTDLGFPLVIKSADVGGQLGLYRLESVTDLERVFEESQSNSVSGEVILEQFLVGPEINVVAVVIHGQIAEMTVSDRIKDPEKGFGVVMEHVYPAELDQDMLGRVRDLCQATVEAMELEDAIIFPQLIVTRDGPYVVETGVRIPGGVMMELFQYATGYNLIRLQIDISLGNPVNLADYRDHPGNRSVMVKFINGDPGPLKSGKVQKVAGRQEAMNVPGVVETQYYNDPTAPQEIRPLKEGRDRFYYVIAVGEKREDVVAATSRATELLDFLDEHGNSLKTRPV